MAVQLTRPLDEGISGTALEKLHFHHVRQCTVGHLGFSATHGDFWRRLVLPTAHSDTSVKHAVVALGMAHRVFMECSGTESLHGLMLQQYNAAIRHLMDSSSGDTAGTRQTLICCLIFFCLETVMGHYTQSLQHLRAGSRVLDSHLQQASLEGKYCAKRRVAKQGDDMITDIADVFAVLGVDTGHFMDENLTPGLVYHTLPDMDDDMLGVPFADLVDARRHVNAIVVDFNRTVEFHRHDWFSPDMCTLYERFKRWARRFDRTTFTFAKVGPTSDEQHELSVMKIARKLWMAVIDQGDKVTMPTSNPEYNKVFHDILDDAERLIEELAAVPYPVFSLQADTVPPLAFICDLNTDPGIQQRAINLLRRVKRREGIWDSHEVADYLEDFVQARRLFQVDWDALAGGVPATVRVISDLNLSTMDPCNGIVRLAAENGEGLSCPKSPSECDLFRDYLQKARTPFDLTSDVVHPSCRMIPPQQRHLYRDDVRSYSAIPSALERIDKWKRFASLSEGCTGGFHEAHGLGNALCPVQEGYLVRMIESQT